MSVSLRIRIESKQLLNEKANEDGAEEEAKTAKASQTMKQRHARIRFSKRADSVK